MTVMRSWGITLARLAVGVVFLAHGAQKLFVYHFSGVAQSFGHMGIPLPGFSAVVVTLVEFFGGLALILGLGTRIAAALIAIDMLGAIAFVHFKGGFFLPRGFEYAFTMLMVNAGLVLAGAGAMALDNLFGRRNATEVRAIRAA